MTKENNNDYRRIMAVAKNRGMLDQRLIESASQFAEQIHADEIYLNEPFMTHPWAVARIITDMQLDSELIAAALLHDVVEHGADIKRLEERFEPTVADMVLNLTMNQTGKDPDSDSILYHDRLVDKIVSDFGPLYIKLASRIHNLQTFKRIGKGAKDHDAGDELHARKIKEAEEFYLPLAESTGIIYLWEMLRNACFKAKFPNEYHNIQRQYNYLLRDNKNCTERVKELFTRKFYHQEIFASQVFDCKVEKCRICDINDSIKLPLRESGNNYEQVITKYQIPLFDMFLILKDQDAVSLTDQFLRLHKEVIAKESLFIISIELCNNKSCINLILRDIFSNQYHLSVYSQSSYELYLYGRNPRKSRYLPKKYRGESEKVFFSKIKVFTKDNAEKTIAREATVLDFAFLIHENIGLCAEYGIVNGEEVPLNTILSEYDHIQIVTAREDGREVVRACFEWFEYVKTPRAIHILIRWFKNNYVLKEF